MALVKSAMEILVDVPEQLQPERGPLWSGPASDPKDVPTGAYRDRAACGTETAWRRHQTADEACYVCNRAHTARWAAKAGQP